MEPMAASGMADLDTRHAQPDYDGICVKLETALRHWVRGERPFSSDGCGLINALPLPVTGSSTGLRRRGRHPDRCLHRYLYKNVKKDYTLWLMARFILANGDITAHDALVCASWFPGTSRWI